MTSEQNGQSHQDSQTSEQTAQEQQPEPLPPDVAQTRFQMEFERVLAEDKVRIAYLGYNSAIIVAGKSINHLLHAWLTMLTLGLWGIVWLILALRGGEHWWAVTADNLVELYFARVPLKNRRYLRL